MLHSCVGPRDRSNGTVSLRQLRVGQFHHSQELQVANPVSTLEKDSSPPPLAPVVTTVL